MALNLEGFHTIYINCFVNTDAINNTEAFGAAQRELPNLLEANTEDKIAEVIEKIRAAFRSIGVKQKTCLDEFKSKSKDGKTFWNMFDSEVPFVKQVKTLFISRIKTLQDEYKKYQIKDVAEFLNNAEFFTELKKRVSSVQVDESKPKIAILVEDFHTIFRNCFIDSFSYYTSRDTKLQNQLFRLALIDPKDQEGSIFEKIKELREAFISNDAKETDTFQRLQETSKAESQGAKLFWSIFSSKLPFEKDENVRKICIRRIKALQDELEELGIQDEASLTQFLYDPDYFKTTEDETSKTKTSKYAGRRCWRGKRV